jgi:L-cysteine:1D-myo-inositol 2-amino-2-deoxy-alpha-D-glucopyranoside ligase
MLLYDTATREVHAFEPAGDPISLYVCGITPYDAAHLGHAFTYHVFDVITRRLQRSGHGVRSVRNITDVDDDILRTARRRGIDFRVLAAEQVSRFDREMAAVGIMPPTSTPSATGHVAEMVTWIADLERLGFAYARDGWVYFEVARFDRYGSLSRLTREQMIAVSRDGGADPDDPRKRDPLDFVLWQPSLQDEPRWPSPWGDGRPGWHIECSVLATGQLGATIDLHGGGDDLIYPHHESEIAQVEATGVHPFARHWVHVAMVRLEGVKMSKSLGNLVFVGDLLASASGAVVRLMLAQHHYRSSWEYRPDELPAAEARHRRYRDCVAGGRWFEAGQAQLIEREFDGRLDDDLNTAGALAVIDAAVAQAVPASRLRPAQSVAAEVLLPRLLGVLGVELPAVVAEA